MYLCSNVLYDFTKERVDKTMAKKDREFNQQISGSGVNDLRNQGVFPGGAMSVGNNSVLPTPKIPQPKVDAIDRRQIESHNEDKSHTTKEELDDIKRTHYKEKKKKEQSNMEPGPSGLSNHGWVRRKLILLFEFLALVH